MICTQTAAITLATGITYRPNNPVLSVLSAKGLAAAFMTTTYRLQQATKGNTTLDLAEFPEYLGLVWIKDRLSQMRVDLSLEVNELEDKYKVDVDLQFLKHVKKQLKSCN